MPWLPAGGFGAEGEYMAWVEADLAAAAANPDVKWIVAGGHRPFEDLPDATAQTLITLFKTYGVALYVAGHGHTYSRYDASAWGDDTVHIMAGAAGCEETPFPSDQFAESVEDMKEFGKSPRVACEEWCKLPEIQDVTRGKRDPCNHCTIRGGAASPAFTTDKLSIGVLEASETALQWKLLRAPDGLVLDSILISK